jgi:hypothetical protein
VDLIIVMILGMDCELVPLTGDVVRRAGIGVLVCIYSIGGVCGSRGGAFLHRTGEGCVDVLPAAHNGVTLDAIELACEAVSVGVAAATAVAAAAAVIVVVAAASTTAASTLEATTSAAASGRILQMIRSLRHGPDPCVAPSS